MVSEPPRPSVVTSRSRDMPWNPATTGTPPASRVARSRSPRTSRILARVWTVSVIIPAWLPVKDTASTPRSARAMHSRDMVMRSPELSSMSISRSGCTELTSPASRTRSSVVLPMALTTTTTSFPARLVRATWSATARMRSASPTDVPPNFWTTSDMVRKATTRRPTPGVAAVPAARIRGRSGGPPDRLPCRTVGTEKRERQKAGRQPVVEAEEKAAKRKPGLPPGHHHRHRRGWSWWVCPS